MPNCEECPKSKFVAPVTFGDGTVDMGPTTYTSDGITLYKGSVSVEACVPKQSQMSPEAGQAIFTAGTAAEIARSTITTANDLTACIAACTVTTNCIVQFNASAAANSRCVLATFNPVASTAPATATSELQFVYKLPPAGLVAASSVPNAAGKMMSSGHYAHSVITGATLAQWQTVGTNLTSDARTFSTNAATSATLLMKECKKACDNSNVCIGFIAQYVAPNSPTVPAGSVNCYFRGGVDALSTRSFFAIPAGATEGLQW